MYVFINTFYTIIILHKKYFKNFSKTSKKPLTNIFSIWYNIKAKYECNFFPIDLQPTFIPNFDPLYEIISGFFYIRNKIINIKAYILFLPYLLLFKS